MILFVIKREFSLNGNLIINRNLNKTITAMQLSRNECT